MSQHSQTRKKPANAGKNRTSFGIDPKSGKLAVGSLRMRMPQSRPARIVVGVGLIFGGFLGFLPVLGFWMAPLGVLVLSHDLAPVRRWRRRVAVWWSRRRDRSGKRG